MPEKQFLYQSLNAFSQFGGLDKDIPDSITLNLSPQFQLRHYQIEAFARFLHCFTNDFPEKSYPLHFLYNMATGSGKTLIMAGLILYLYQQDYRNFLFFVNSTNIIEKTKDNFLKPSATKYLFNQDITIDNRRVNVSSVNNFEGVNPNKINICFTTIQKLHSDLTTLKENALTFEDFRKHKIILIADEAHHMNVSTKSQSGRELFESWENTVQNIFEQNRENILLEFTATHDYSSPAMVEKYRDKVIFRYDLQEFRNDKFSKDITLVYSDFGLDERILQALILSQYKQEVASKYRINLKPVILLKAQRTIAQSLENEENFYRLIENLSSRQIARVRQSNIPIVQQAFQFFADNDINDEQLVERLKREFRQEFCISVNRESEKKEYQILVNTLEDKNNRIRAIFTVQKLNEGWDVLNLFDIVRCYEPRDTGRAKIGKTTMSEAQLIGRGARYFPFILPEQKDRFRRKFDNDLNHELRVIEELHYHSINDNRYISEIRRALIKEGMLDDHEVTKEIKLKDSFKKTRLYKYGLIYKNRQVKKDYHHVFSFDDLGVTKKNFIYKIATGRGGTRRALSGKQQASIVSEETRLDVPLKDIERNIIQSAIARNPFYTFHSLTRYFPNIKSINQFVDSEEYLGGLEITFQGNIYHLKENKVEKLHAMLNLLGEIETQIRSLSSEELEGSRNFIPSRIHDIFKDKPLKLLQDSERLTEEEQINYFVSSKDWFAFDSLYGTSEERAFVRMLDRQIDKLQSQYDDIYLVRNEGHFSIYNFSDGKTFQPDFVLFLKEKNGQSLTYQLFIEPKGAHLTEHDRWKEQFLQEIKEEFVDKILTFHGESKYRLIGIPFYNNEDENAFRETLDSALLD
ncbi:MAG: DEAD/DEAH box helicase family protein [Chloroflexota bacterium]|nr:DEAD/DEAH box helicase family protein [Chloroflexota bacterium]